ncbi:hypothetical protein Bca101_018907 [Brassica carinata]
MSKSVFYAELNQGWRWRLFFATDSLLTIVLCGRNVGQQTVHQEVQPTIPIKEDVIQVRGVLVACYHNSLMDMKPESKFRPRMYEVVKDLWRLSKESTDS